MAIQALNQLRFDSDMLSETGSNKELGNTPANMSCMENIKTTQEFIKDISAATFENRCLDDDVIHRLCKPSAGLITISDPDIHLSVDLFLVVTNTSEETYHACHNVILLHYPDSGILSYHAVKKLLAETMGIIAIYDDMCINSCHTFTGPFSQL